MGPIRGNVQTEEKEVKEDDKKDDDSKPNVEDDKKDDDSKPDGEEDKKAKRPVRRPPVARRPVRGGKAKIEEKETKEDDKKPNVEEGKKDDDSKPDGEEDKKVKRPVRRPPAARRPVRGEKAKIEE